MRVLRTAPPTKRRAGRAPQHVHDRLRGRIGIHGWTPLFGVRGDKVIPWRR